MITYHPVTSEVKKLTGTRKKQFRLVLSSTIQPTSGWDGGSREYHELVNFKTGKSESELLASVQGDYFSKQTKKLELPLDLVLVTTGVFCGKPATPTITARPDQAREVAEWLGITLNLD